MAGPDVIFTHLQKAILEGDLIKLDRYLKHPRSPKDWYVGTQFWRLALGEGAPDAFVPNFAILQALQLQFPTQPGEEWKKAFEIFFNKADLKTQEKMIELFLQNSLSESQTISSAGFFGIAAGLITLSNPVELQKNLLTKIWSELSKFLEREDDPQYQKRIIAHYREQLLFHGETTNYPKSQTSFNAPTWGWLYLIQTDEAPLGERLSTLGLQTAPYLIHLLTHIQDFGVSIDWDNLFSEKRFDVDVLIYCQSKMEEINLQKNLPESSNDKIPSRIRL